MAPERPYRSRYLLYKKGSQQVVTWLYETASGLGPTKSLDQLKVIDLLSFAGTIAKATPKIELPPSIASTLSDVIYLRQQAHEWYTSLARDDAATDTDRVGAINTSHRFFIDVLKRVRATLNPIGVKATKYDLQQQPSPFFDVSNVFASLDLEDSCDHSQVDTVAEPADLGTTADVFAGKPEDEQPFTIWCMLQDLSDVRIYVRQLWRQYYNGDFTVPVATLLTDMAFRVVSDIVAAVEDKSLRWCATIMLALDLKANRRKAMQGEISDVSSAVDKRANGLEAADLFCIPAWCIMQDLQISSHLSREGCPPRDEFKYFKGHPLGAALRGLQDQLQSLPKRTDRFGVVGHLRLDYFTYNLRNICQDHCLPTEAVVQCQMYMDIYDALGRQTNVTESMLRPAAAAVPRSLREYLQAYNGQPQYQEHIKKRSEGLLMLANISLEDSFLNAEVDKACRPSSLFAVLPILAGTYLYELTRRTSLFAIECANQSFDVLGAAYLYAALEDKPEWANMELLLTQHKNYVPRSSSLDKHIRNFENAVGAEKITHRRTAGRGIPMSVGDGETSLGLAHYSRALRGTPEEHDAFPSALYTAIRLHRGKRFTSRYGSKSAVGLLSAFAKALVDDEASGSIDYFRLSARCKTLFRLIWKDFEPRLRNILADSDAYAATHQHIVHAILREASDTARAADGNAPTAVLSSLKPYFDDMGALEIHGNLVPRSFSGCIPDQDKPCNRWSWGDDDRPGYIKGKKVFGPETPWDYMYREVHDKSLKVLRGAMERWEAELTRHPNIPPSERKLNEIENWAHQEFVKAGIPARLKRIDRVGNDLSFGYQQTWCHESARRMYFSQTAKGDTTLNRG